jgi:hypothetical protein
MIKSGNNNLSWGVPSKNNKNLQMKKLSRRHFLQSTSTAIGGGFIAAALPAFTTTAENKNKYEGKKLNIALVGLGRYAGYLAEGLQEAQYCRLSGIVTGTPSKAVPGKSATTFRMATFTIIKTSTVLKTTKTLTWYTSCCPIRCTKNTQYAQRRPASM